jgi:hypothetical protein
VSAIEIMRIPLSLPCQVPVVPGTGDATAPIEQRTERCAADAWWMVGRAFLCSQHLRLVLGDDEFNATVAEWILHGGAGLADSETKPWAERHRYDQASATPEWEL